MAILSFNNIDLSREDFPDTLQGWVAFSIVFASGVQCADKNAALEYLFEEADEIIQRIQEDSNSSLPDESPILGDD